MQSLSLVLVCAWFLGAVVLFTDEAAAQYQSSYQQQQMMQQQQQAYNQQLAGQYYLRQQEEQQRRQQEEQQARQRQEQIFQDQQRQLEQQQAQNRQSEEERLRRQQDDNWRRQQEEENDRRRRDQNSSWRTQAGGGPNPSPPDSAPVPDTVTTPSNQPSTGFVPRMASAFGSTSRWGLTVLGLALIGLGLCVVAARVLTRRSTGATPAGNSQSGIDPLATRAARMASQTRAVVSSNTRTVIAKLCVLVRRAAESALLRLRQLVPSRLTALRIGCLLVGLALLVFSFIGFTKGNIFSSFVLLSVGYAIASCFWFLRWFLERASSTETMPALAGLRGAPAQIRPRTRQAARANLAGDLEQRQRENASELPVASTNVRTVRLKCKPCGRQFDLRGAGALGFRQILCPHCSSALEVEGDQQTTTEVMAPVGVSPAVVSVVCNGCRGIIDVPSSAVGTLVPCPRCQARLFVPGEAPAMPQVSLGDHHEIEPMRPIVADGGPAVWSSEVMA